MELEKIKPRGSSLILSNGCSFELRPFSLDDEIWLKETFGDDLPKMFSAERIDMEAFSRIVYRQIVNKSPLARQEFKEFDEDGNEIVENIGGCKLLRRMITGDRDQAAVVLAFGELIKNSRPELSEDEIKELSKKKLQQTGQ